LAQLLLVGFYSSASGNPVKSAIDKHAELPINLLEHLATAVVLIDEHLCVSFVNPTAESLLELSGARVAGKSIHQLLTENGRPLTGLKQCLRDGNIYTKRQASLTLHSGHGISVDYTLTPIQHHDAHFLLFECQVLDRLLKISRETNMLSSQQTSRALIRSLAHEIKNPLGGLRGAAQLLAKELPEPSLQEYTDIIIAEADRLRDLVDRLLGPHHISQQQSLNLHEVLERVIQLVNAESGGTIAFERDYDPSIPNLIGDKGKLIQAVLNIVRNAMQAFDEDTPVPMITLSSRVLRQFTIGDQRHRLACQIDIRDNGPGIKPELVQTIFFPMVSGRPKGTGLGLSIAQSILNQHQGLIECASKPGDTRFTLYLPLKLETGATT
jgi:two-component system nitrogen regulation sensor histidine kinase GlnL